MDVESAPTGEVSYTTSSKDTTSGDANAVERVEIEPTKNGGFSVRCFHKGGKKDPYPRPESYAFSTHDELQNFLMDTFGGKSEDAAESE